jgi:hypothetical protein
MLAQLQTVDADWLKNLVIIGLAVASPLIALYASRRSTRVEPDPLRVQAVDRLVTKEECGTLHKQTEAVQNQLFAKISAVDHRLAEQVMAIRTEMHGMETRLNHVAEERMVKVHDRVNEILAAENETRGTLTEVAKQLAALTQEVHKR